MATYNSYKDSGVKWLGQIPSHWETGKMREFFSERKQLSQDGSEMLLSVSEYSGITPSTNDAGENVSRSASLVGYKKCKATDLIINIMLAWKRGLGISDYDGIVSPAYCVFGTQNINPRYANYLLRTDLYTAEFKRNSTGIIESRLRMYPDDFKNIVCIKPPQNEQEAIVAYLDKITRDIDRAIEAQQKMIDALNERKQIIITRAVTRGLNSDAPLRDSGIDWLGQIPEHWKVSAFRRYIDILTDYTSNGSFADLAANVTYLDEPNYSRLIRLTDLRLGLNNKGVWIDKSSHNFLKNSELFGGELLMACVGAYAGYTCIMPNIEGKASLAPNMFLIKTKKALNTYFAKYYLDSIFDKIQNIAISSAQPKLNKQDVRSIAILVPSLQEQEEIVNYIDMAVKNINVQLSMCERMISLLQERKQIIINEVVTGKTKVI